VIESPKPGGKVVKEMKIEKPMRMCVNPKTPGEEFHER
jgi:hypothetical protein